MHHTCRKGKHMQFTPTGSSITPTPSALMDDILDIRDTLNAELENQKPIDPIVPGELSEAFTMLDPDLAYLNKEMKSAAVQLQTSIKQGRMIDMAQWRFDSAKSAYMTRLHELKDDKSLQKFAQKTINGECDVERAKRDLRNLSMQEAMNDKFAKHREQKAKDKREKEEKENGWFFYMMLGLFLMQLNAQQRKRNMDFSKMRNDFSTVRTA